MAHTKQARRQRSLGGLALQDWTPGWGLPYSPSTRQWSVCPDCLCFSGVFNPTDENAAVSLVSCPCTPQSLGFLPSWLAITRTGRFVSKMAEIIETESGIRALQAALVERRNKDRLGHVFCNLRLIILPGGTQEGRGGGESAPPWSAGEGG